MNANLAINETLMVDLRYDLIVIPYLLQYNPRLDTLQSLRFRCSSIAIDICDADRHLLISVRPVIHVSNFREFTISISNSFNRRFAVAICGKLAQYVGILDYCFVKSFSNYQTVSTHVIWLV